MPDLPTLLATGPRRLVLIHNPAAGQRRRRKTEAVLALLRAAGCAIDLRPTTGPGDGAAIAAALTAADADLVVAAGGDGTINEVVNGLAAAPGPVPPLAILPLGTANVLAAEIGLATAGAAVARTVTHGQPRRIHLGRAGGRHFVLMAGVGLDAQAVAHVSLLLKRRAGKLAYVVAVLRQLLRYRFPVCRVEVDGIAYPARTVVVCNGRLYGGPFVVAPQACLEQPGFQVVMLQRGGVWNSLRYAAALLVGRLPRLRDVKIVAGRHVRIDGEAGAPVQGDGDVIAQLPVEITVADACLDLVYPTGGATTGPSG